MNVKLLREVKKHILAEPRRLLMQDWIRRKHKSDDTVSYENEVAETRERAYPRCGTVGCIAGWAIVLSRQDAEFSHGQFSHGRVEAGDLLGLSPDQADRLFYRGYWPRKFKDGIADDGKRKTARVAARRIEHFIKTEGRE